MRNLCAGQEATVRTRHGTMDWVHIGEGVSQECTSSPCFLNANNSASCEVPGCLNHKLEPWLPGEIPDNLTYAGDITLMADSEEELKSLLMKVKEESENVSLKLNIQKIRSWHSDSSFHGNRWGRNANSDRFYFLGLQNHCRQWLQPWN